MGLVDLYHVVVSLPHAVQCYITAGLVAAWLACRSSTKPTYKEWRPADPNAPIIRKLRETAPHK